MSVPNKHSSCNMQAQPIDCGPRFIGEAIELGQKEVAIATSEVRSLKVLTDSSRIDLQDVTTDTRFELFIPEDVLESTPTAELKGADSVTSCESVPTRLIANKNVVYIRQGTLDASQTNILETGYDHRCEYDAPTPSEFMNELLSIVE